MKIILIFFQMLREILLLRCYGTASRIADQYLMHGK